MSWLPVNDQHDTRTIVIDTHALNYSLPIFLLKNLCLLPCKRISAFLIYQLLFEILWQHTKGERDYRINIDSDEETDGSFSCLTEKCTGSGQIYGVIICFLSIFTGFIFSLRACFIEVWHYLGHLRHLNCLFKIKKSLKSNPHKCISDSIFSWSLTSRFI